MSNLLQDGATWLAGQLQDHAGRDVVLRRQGQAPTELTGTVVMQQYDVVDEETGIVLTVLSYDWVFTASEYRVAGVQVPPLPYDRLEETLAGSSIAFEVMGLGRKPCWEWLDTSGIMLLVHSKKVV